MRLFRRRRPERFIQMLIDQASKTLEGMEALEEFMSGGNESCAKQVAQAEEEADEIRRILIDELNRSFVTPIDREDIFGLSRAIDDIIDYGYTTIDEMVVLKVQPNLYLHRMASLLKEAAKEIHMATLRMADHPNVANDHAMRAKALENRVEQVYREAVADLFSGPKDLEHVFDTLKLRELYRHLSNCADRGDEAANVIADIVVKMG